MKLLLISSLFGLAFGAEVAMTNRKLAVNDRYEVLTLVAALDETTATVTDFIVTAGTNEGDNNNGGPYYLRFYATCPHGDLLNAGTPLDASSWASVTNAQTVPSGNAEPSYTTTFNLEITNGVFSSSVFATTTDSQDDVDGGVATFCLWYGMGASDTNSELFGFREIEFEITYTWNKVWEFQTMTTQAYDPTGEEGLKTIQVVASTQCMEPFPLRPGMEACITICPPSTEANLKVSGVRRLVMTETSIPDTDAPNGVVGSRVIVGYNEDVDFVNVDVTPVAQNGLANRCQQVKWLLPAQWFPQIANPPSNPLVSTFKLTGKAPLAAYTRRLDSGRGLEESAGEADVVGEYQWTLAPGAEASSARGVMAGAAAAAGALGAALLL